jgi:hypothetical protein
VFLPDIETARRSRATGAAGAVSPSLIRWISYIVPLMSSAPVRVRLSRRSGFRLQDVSLALNGRAAVVVARHSRWGNPFSLETYGRTDALSLFKQYLQQNGGPGRPLDPQDLRGRNLACWCAPDQACHADILLEWANG